MRWPIWMSLSVLLLPSVAARHVTGQAAVSSRATPVLPVPAGRYAIGRQSFDLVDSARADPYVVGGAGHRELMIWVWYPARSGLSAARAEYFPGAAQIDRDAAARPVAQDVFGSVWSRIVSGAIRSHAITNAVPASESTRFPVVLFSHGSSASVFSYTTAIEDLASHGYVVVAIEHTDAAGIVRFSDSRLRLFRDPPERPGAASDPLQAMILSAKSGTETGADDVRFVLNTLAQGKVPLAKMMNLKRVAAVGHSYGGTLAARACQIDQRLTSCISEDGEVNPVGVFFDYPDTSSLSQPFLFLEIVNEPSEEQLGRMGETRAQWNGFLEHEREQLAACGEGSYHVLLHRAGMNHASFSDGPLLNAAFGSRQETEARENLFVTERLVRGFLDRTLKNESGAFAREALDSNGLMREGVTIEKTGR